MKYIRYNDDIKTFNIFPDFINHSDIFDNSKELLSAGKCSFHSDLKDSNKIYIIAIAESISLNFKFNSKQSETDSEFLTIMVNIFNK
jgi:hypothetical protein